MGLSSGLSTGLRSSLSQALGGRGGSTGPIFDADAATYIASVEGASGDNQALEEGVKLAINAFVVGCKADGIWNAIKASCILAGARTLNGALRPLKGTAPTNAGGLFVSGDYNRKTGLVGNGSTKYLDANRNNNADPQNSNHFSVYGSSFDSGQKVYIGSFGPSNTPRQAIFHDSGNLVFSSRTSGNVQAATAFQSSGFAGVRRDNSETVEARYGLLGFSASVASVTPSSTSFFIFAFSQDGTPNFVSASRLAFYSIGESLDLALLDARVTSLINAIDGAI
jgi:hypothetical protein